MVHIKSRHDRARARPGTRHDFVLMTRGTTGTTGTTGHEFILWNPDLYHVDSSVPTFLDDDSVKYSLLVYMIDRHSDNTPDRDLPTNKS